MKSDFIYNPSDVGDFCHSASIVEFNKTLYSAWYAYREKEYEKGDICFSKYNENDQKWEKGKIAFEHLKNSSCGNPVIFVDKKTNKLQMFFVILQRHYWDSAQIFHSEYNDQVESWSQPEKVNIDNGIMVRHRPQLTTKGSYFIPAYDEKKFETIIYESVYPFLSWNLVSKIEGELIQGDLIHYQNNEWQIFLRPAGDSDKYIYKALSADNCHSFQTIIKTHLPCPLSGIAAIKTQNNSIILSHNNTEEFKRSPLNLNSIIFGEVYFSNNIEVDTGDLELSYPCLLERENRDLILIYTYNRKMIKSIIFKPEEIYGL